MATSGSGRIELGLLPSGRLVASAAVGALTLSVLNNIEYGLAIVQSSLHFPASPLPVWWPVFDFAGCTKTSMLLCWYQEVFFENCVAKL